MKTQLADQPRSNSSTWLLYSIAILWGALSGIVFYIIVRLPLWYTYNTSPSSETRGAFFDSGILILMGLGIVINAIYHGVTIGIWRNQRAQLQWIYPVNGVINTLLIMFLITLLDYSQNPGLYHPGHFRFELLALLSLPALIGLVALGLVTVFGLKRLGLLRAN